MLSTVALLASLAAAQAALVPQEPPSPLPLPHTLSSEAYQALLYRFLESRRYDAPGWAVDKGVRDTGPFIDNTSYGTHQAARIWYSPKVIDWLENGREGTIPDGAMMVKEMFDPPAARYAGLDPAAVDSAVTSWAVMVRDSAGALDGWYWSFYMPGQAVDDPDRPPFDYPNSGFGQYCVRCHASAEKEMTFASLENVAGYPGGPVTFRVDDSWIPEPHLTPAGYVTHESRALGPADEAGGLGGGSGDSGTRVNRAFADLFRQIEPVPDSAVSPIPSVAHDHVWAAAAEPPRFLTSDQCLSCHDGQGPPFGPNMFIPGEGGMNVNLSPYGEWRWSMMGLAGRDPIFYAQLESELATYPEPVSDTIQNLCFTCHGVMGQRAFQADHPDRLFDRSIPGRTGLDDPLHRYGALARDGVSCTVCHQILDDGLPLDSIVTGRFRMADPGSVGPGFTAIYGPFEEPAVRAMEQSLAMRPIQSDYLRSSRLCASCHSVKLPVYDRDGTRVGEVFEQSTYLEWQNSAYQNELGGGGADPKTCQDCHMPTTFPYLPDDATGDTVAQPLAFRIANIQDQTYPEAEHRAPLDSIDVPIRPEFARHTLAGINLFALEMFDQFEDILGVRKRDYMTYSLDGLPFALEVGRRLARQHTARVRIEGVERTGTGIRATVRVTNLAGHRLPSGVGFRRAFLELRVTDASGGLLWASGRTDEVGVIVDGEGRPLPSEFFDEDPATGEQSYQPHHRAVTRQDQVQIYQELVKDTEGRFTTSFLGIADHVKDNRLLPVGWTPEGPEGFEHAEWTMPRGGALGDRDFLDGTGSDRVVYEIEIPPERAAEATVEATLYYQSIPPYYLRDRFRTAPDGEATRRLHYLGSRLRTEGTAVEDWKLRVAADTAVLN